MKKPEKKRLERVNTMSNSMAEKASIMGLSAQPVLHGIRQEERSMNAKEEIKMSVTQMELLLAHLPDGVVMEILWEGIHGEKT